MQAEEIYKESLAQYTQPDFYHLQELPISRHFWRYCDMLKLTGHIDEKLAYNQGRTLLEDTYAVMSFERMGCRIIRPSAPLVQAMLNTEVSFELNEIRAPHPHVYIELPPEINLQAPEFMGSGNSRVEGFYVTWSEVGAKTREFEKQQQGKGLARNQYGVPVPADAPDAVSQDPILNSASADAFGDYFARFLVVARASNSNEHLWSDFFFNLHWRSDSKEMAEGAFKRFSDIWRPSAEGTSFGYDLGDKAREQFFHLAANIFLYMSMPKEIGDTVFIPDPDREAYRQHGRQWNNKRRKRFKAFLQEDMPPEVYIVGQHIVVDRNIEAVDTQPGNPLEGSRLSPRTHWRRGHWRSVWVGTGEDQRRREPRWIKPVLIVGRGGEAAEETIYELK